VSKLVSANLYLAKIVANIFYTRHLFQRRT